MKQDLLYFSLIIIVFFFACDERKVETFQGENEIYFDKFWMNEIAPGTASADSSVYSFFFYPTPTTQIRAALVVNLSGFIPKRDLRYGLRVVEEGTTATSDEYLLEEEYWFRVKEFPENIEEIQDTLYLFLIRSPRLTDLENGLRLMVELVPSEDVNLGQYERQRAIIVFTEFEEYPEWWDDEVEEYLLGKYSKEKYKTFLDNIDGAEMVNVEMLENEPSKMIELVLEFKAWLNKNPTYEKDGSRMTVVI